MGLVPIVYIYGTTDSGKTRLVERLLEGLGRAGLSVGTVKRSAADALDLDTEGKDTQRHVAAGATATAASSLSDAALFVPSALPIERLIAAVLAAADVDLVLVEGLGGDAPEFAPKIAVGTVKEAAPTTMLHLPDGEAPLEAAVEIIDKIVKRAADHDRVLLRVEGREVHIKPFVEDFLEGTVRGAIGALEDTGEPGDEVELRLPRRPARD